MIIQSKFTKYLIHLSILIIPAICLSNIAFADGVNSTQWNNYFLGKSVDDNIHKSYQIFRFQYKVTNGTMDKLAQGSNGSEDLTSNLHSTNNGTFYLKVPRNYPSVQEYDNASAQPTPGVYFILNGVQAHYSVSTLDCFFVYSIPFSGNSEMEIIFSYPAAYDLQNVRHGYDISSSCNRQTIVSYMPPLEQIRAGIEPKNVQCVTGLVTVLHPGNNMPSCVNHETLKILVERGWAKTSS